MRAVRAVLARARCSSRCACRDRPRPRPTQPRRGCRSCDGRARRRRAWTPTTHSDLTLHRDQRSSTPTCTFVAAATTARHATPARRSTCAAGTGVRQPGRTSTRDARRRARKLVVAGRARAELPAGDARRDHAARRPIRRRRPTRATSGSCRRTTAAACCAARSSTRSSAGSWPARRRTRLNRAIRLQ